VDILSRYREILSSGIARISAAIGIVGGAGMTAVHALRVDLIDAGTNVRETTDEGLVASIRRHGVLQPIVVRRTGRRYEVVMGHRRLAAARRLELETVPALVEETVHDDQVLRQVVENVERRAMNPLDIARALKAHLDEHPGTTKRALAEAMGKPGARGQVWIANKLALLNLDDATQERIEAGDLPEYLAIKQRARLGDGRGRPRAVSLPDDEGRSKSILVEIGSDGHGPRKGLFSIGVEHDARTVDLVVEDRDRRIFLTLTPTEAKLLGRRLTQAWEAIA
jgi:ParB/RepB/Spo0J family partition protein